MQVKLSDFINCMLKIGLPLGTHEPISFKLGVMIDTSELYLLIPVFMILTLTQGHQVAGKLELVQSSGCKVVCMKYPNFCSG